MYNCFRKTTSHITVEDHTKLIENVVEQKSVNMGRRTYKGSFLTADYSATYSSLKQQAKVNQEN